VLCRLIPPATAAISNVLPDAAFAEAVAVASVGAARRRLWEFGFPDIHTHQRGNCSEERPQRAGASCVDDKVHKRASFQRRLMQVTQLLTWLPLGGLLWLARALWSCPNSRFTSRDDVVTRATAAAPFPLCLTQHRVPAPLSKNESHPTAVTYVLDIRTHLPYA